MQIGDSVIPVMSFDVTSGSYGSVGHMSMTTSLRMLEGLNIDLVTVSSASTVVPATVYAESGSVSMMQIFDGDVTSTEWDFDSDTVTLRARDHAGIFVDQKRILTRDAPALTQVLTPLSPGQTLTPQGVSTINRKVSQIVTDIASDFGYTPVIRMAQGTDVISGAAYGSTDHAYMTIPQNLWSILNTLARDTGNEVYTTPDRKLVFGVPGAGLSTLSLSYKVPVSLISQSGGLSRPVSGLKIVHNPRRNGTFRVLVVSYDPARAVATIGRATYVGDNLSQSSIKQGIHVGSDAQQVDKQLLQSAQTRGIGSSSEISHVQLYTFYWDGLTNDDAQARASAIATDISKRLMLMSGRIDGYPTLLPTQPLTLQGPISSTFTGNTWYVSAYTHRFRMPAARSSTRGSWDGFSTHFTSLDLPSTALAQKVH